MNNIVTKNASFEMIKFTKKVQNTKWQKKGIVKSAKSNYWSSTLLLCFNHNVCIKMCPVGMENDKKNHKI